MLVFYIDETFLQGGIGTKPKIIVEKKSKRGREVTLLLTYWRKGKAIEGQDIFIIKEKGKTATIIEPKMSYGSFSLDVIRKMLKKTGFRVRLYSGSQRTTFTLNRWNAKSPFPIFICEKPLSD